MAQRSLTGSLPIAGQGLLLREWRLEPDDVKALLEAHRDPAIAAELVSRGETPLDSETAAERWICAGYELAYEGLGLRLAISAGGEERVLGAVALDVLDGDADQLEISLWVLAPERRRALARRALKAALDWLPPRWPQGRLWVTAPSGDRAPAPALRHCGFRPPGQEPLPQALRDRQRWLFQRPVGPAG